MRKTSKRALNRTSALFGVVAALLPIAAHAQDAPPPAPAPAQASEEEDVIVVTGSRVRSEFNSPSPIQIITTENSSAAGISSVAAMIQNSSIAAGSPQNDAVISSAFVTEGGPGSETVSLRGLGANRTLVLLNGRRAGPAGTRGQVGAFDLNVVPFSIVDRVEVLKDGASSIYGSDAIAGVVNIITRRDMDGGDANLYYSHPFDEGGEEIAGDVSWGQTFDGGYFNIGLDYSFQAETTLGSRDYTNCAVDRRFDATTGERTDLVDVRTGDFACANNVSTGLVWLYDYSYLFNADVNNPDGFYEGRFGREPGPNFLQYDGSGQIGQLLPQTVIPGVVSAFSPTAPTNWFVVSQDFDADTQGVVNTNSPYEQDSSLIPETERGTFFAEVGFDLSPGVEAYAELLFNRRETKTNGFRQIWNYVYSYDLGDPFSAGWGGASILSPTFLTDHFDQEVTVEYRRIVAGLRGDTPGRLSPVHWDIFFQDSHSDGEYTFDIIFDDAMRSQEGRSDFGTEGIFRPNSIPRPTASCVGYVTPISNRECIDIDWLDPALINAERNFTAEEQAFLFGEDTGNTEYTQRYVEGSITTDIFSLPAGNVGAALGVVARYDEITDVPGPITRSGNSWRLSSAGITTGDDLTAEVFGEIAIPLFANTSFAESVDLVLSGRFTDVRSYGSNETYKVGVNWQLTPTFMMRATTGTSFRAPSLYELNLAEQTGFLRQIDVDPCVRWGAALAAGGISQRVADNCATLGIPDTYSGAGSGVTLVSSGNQDLAAETSEAHVLGFIWSPNFINLDLSVDYFDITINDEVTQLGGNVIVYACMNSEDFPDDPICDLFNRGNGGNPFGIDIIDDSYINVATQQNRGIDVTARYEHEFAWGDFSVQGQATYQLEDTVALFPEITRDSNGANGDPEFVGNLDFEFERNDWTFFWHVDMIGPTDDGRYVEEVQGNTRYVIDTDFTAYHAASVRYDFGQWRLLGGVANIFEQEPPAVSADGAALQSYVGPSLLASQYDYLGRRVFVRVSAEF